MIRILLTWILPLLLPTAVYLAWALWARRRRAAEGPELQDVPWTWLLAAGLVLAFLVTGAVFMSGGAGTGRTYVPAYVDEEGRTVPGRFE